MSQYVPKEALVLDLKDFIYRSDERVGKFNTAIADARNPKNGGSEEMKAENIQVLDDYFRFCDDLLRWTPKVSSKGDELLRKLLVFYWVLDQPVVRSLQTPITPASSNVDLTWLSYWLVSFARDMGQFMNTPQSAASVYTFYLNEKYNKEADLWEEPSTGWLSFNHWFARSWRNINEARHISGEGDDNIIVSTADSMYDGNWPIKDGIVSIDGDQNLYLKGVKVNWPIKDLLRTTSDDWKNGHFMHAFLSPTDYHRQHSPVTGKVIEARVIQNQVYLQVEKRKDENGICADRAITRPMHEILRRAKNVSTTALDAPDDAGYQWCQTRGLIVIQTEKHGKVAVLPIGMAQVSSVILTVKVGDNVNKGDNISYFQFGGSDVVVVFEKPVKFRSDLVAGKTKLDVRQQMATFD
jgi:phosphatidylserine decarboxylase